MSILWQFIHPQAESFDVRPISEQTIHIYRGEAERPPDRFTWPAWRSNSFSGINLYYYKVPGGVVSRCRDVVLGVYGGKGLPIGDLSS